ncbi:hypothetical protein CFIMG_000515RA [Ceratocystis fimbriata CBS 114723]|uniref:MRH domain-containing protein n=1 Tax=Ceratocystis fimbriata CBS 114723 TaxID=1035309 RepID=A0A2C5XHS4_9PEZI|nr:hypothetical protein CFIMG_000515RA [Ceratocystis fimbriata CBS 114723]
MARISLTSLLVALLGSGSLSLATANIASASTSSLPSSSTVAPAACTATSVSTLGGFFDLRPDIAVPAPKDAPKVKGVRNTDYEARGWDYGYNFTLNVCSSVVAPVKDVVGIEKSQWQNVSAYYTHEDKVYSLGQESMNLQSRGRKLVLQYKDGSPCESPSSSSSSSSTTRRKSATISFLCASDPLVTSLVVTFVGADPDQCAYFFEARSSHACLSAEPQRPGSGSVGPGSVFTLIAIIAFMVYVLGGVFYNRTVAHARGWRQLPNYSLWASVWSVICDFTTIIVASCARFLPASSSYGTAHYRRLARSPTRSREDENRLIDQLDEEWDD